VQQPVSFMLLLPAALRACVSCAHPPPLAVPGSTCVLLRAVQRPVLVGWGLMVGCVHCAGGSPLCVMPLGAWHWGLLSAVHGWLVWAGHAPGLRSVHAFLALGPHSPVHCNSGCGWQQSPLCTTTGVRVVVV
jgi:hypothetical protein